jgi:beta-glucoside operon transcriptional antiterminator
MKLENSISSNIVFTLADHINFAVKRYNEKMNIKLPILYDIQYQFEIEMDIGKKALSLIKRDLGINLPQDEAAYIALHIVNAEFANKDKIDKKLDEELMDKTTKIIEDHFEIVIDKEGFNYSRFVTHMQYLFKRGKKNELIKDKNEAIYQSLLLTIPEACECTKKIKEYLENFLGYKLTNEECMYIMLHVNRLCTRESYHQ